MWGWASIVEQDGQAVVDLQGDVIDDHELLKMAHDFVSGSRAGGYMHAKGADKKIIQVGEVVESLVFTRDLQKAMGIDLGHIGWLIGMHIPDPDLFQKVKDGQLPAFSIGATGIRVPMEIAE